MEVLYAIEIKSLLEANYFFERMNTNSSVPELSPVIFLKQFFSINYLIKDNIK